MPSLSCAESVSIGIPACGVVSATSRAALVIPGALASCVNVGAFGLGEFVCPLSTA